MFLINIYLETTADFSRLNSKPITGMWISQSMQKTNVGTLSACVNLDQELQSIGVLTALTTFLKLCRTETLAELHTRTCSL